MTYLRNISLCATTVAMFAAQSARADHLDQVINQLAQEGYVRMEVSETFLGRARILAVDGEDGQREIILNPKTGEVLRDYVYGEPARAAAPSRLNGPRGDGEEEHRPPNETSNRPSGTPPSEASAERKPPLPPSAAESTSSPSTGAGPLPQNDALDRTGPQRNSTGGRPDRGNGRGHGGNPNRGARAPK